MCGARSAGNTNLGCINPERAESRTVPVEAQIQLPQGHGVQFGVCHVADRQSAGDVLSPHRKRSLDLFYPPCHLHFSTFKIQSTKKKTSHPQGAQGAQLAAPSNSPPRMGPTKSPTEKHSAKKLKPFACDEKKSRMGSAESDT